MRRAPPSAGWLQSLLPGLAALAVLAELHRLGGSAGGFSPPPSPRACAVQSVQPVQPASALLWESQTRLSPFDPYWDNKRDSHL